MSSSTDRFVELKLKRELLDPNFDGYKLALESLPVYKVPILPEVDFVGLSNKQYSYQHVKAYGLTNSLVLDMWNPDSVYFINNKWEMVKACAKDNAAYISATMFTIPEAADYRLAPGRLNVGFQFVSSTTLVLANGVGKLYIVDTGNRASKPSCKVTYSDSVLGENQFFTLLNCSMLDGGQRLECLLLHVDEVQECEDKSSPIKTVIEWLSFSATPSGWSLDRSRRLDGRTTPDYITVDKNASALLMSSEKPFKFSYDSEAVSEDLPDPSDSASGNGASEAPVYSWSQTREEVIVQIPLPPDTVKSDIVYKLTSDHLQLEVKNRELSLSGSLGGRVDVDASTWTMGDNVLDLTITKHTTGSWAWFIEGDSQGQAVLDPSQQAALEDIASVVKSQTDDDDEDKAKQSYNTQELEDCDIFPEDTAVMVRIDGETHKVTHQANLSCHQWLFNTTSSPQDLPSICLRHDVDGVVWQPKSEYSSTECPWDHIATFNALGYVQASKQNKKFATCAPDYSFAALCDCTRHVYIYRQPQEISSPLRNRKTGRQVGAVAKQQVFGLDNVDQILGLGATNSHVFVCTSNMLYVISIS